MSTALQRLVLTVADVVRDVAIETHARRARTVLLSVAVALSTGALIASTGISTVAARQVDADLAASTINLIALRASAGGTEIADGSMELAFPAEADARAANLRLVEAAGRRLDVSGSVSTVVSRQQPGVVGPAPVSGLTVSGITSGYIAANRTRTAQMRVWLLDRNEPVVFLGTAAADQLDVPVTDDPTGHGIWISGRRYAVAGFLSGGSADLSNGVVIPYALALELVRSDRETTMLVRTAAGAGGPVAEVIRTAVRPDAPERLISSQVAGVENLRAGVSTQMGRFAAWIGAFLLLVTLLLIANSMVVSVMARTAEIGVRRALGSSRARVASLILCEGSLTGLLGGLAGSAVAAATVVIVSSANDWTVVFVPLAIAAGPVIGATAGLISSLYPALRAAGVQPALAVRSE